MCVSVHVSVILRLDGLHQIAYEHESELEDPL